MTMRKLSHAELVRTAATDRIPLYGLLDNVRSLYNVGSMFRTSDGASIRKLLLSGFTPRPPRKEILKTSLGSTESVPWEAFDDPVDAIRFLKTSGITICVLEHTTESIPYHRVTKDLFPLCLIVGNELTGVSHEFIESADLAIDIPMYGIKQSLNVAVAYGIVLYELARTFRSL
jgi:tRNA G18 (ribose-2'-O)-methylase SpoU